MANSIINDTGETWQLPSRGISVLGSLKSYDTYEDLLLDTERGAFAWVDDASGDATVNEGGALYRIKGETIIKILETESMDQIFGMDVPWSRIINKPESSVLSIDGAVSNSHSHENKGLLDLITGTEDEAKLGYNIILTTGNIGKYTSIDEDAVHVHTNMNVLKSIEQDSYGNVTVGTTRLLSTSDIEDIRLKNVVKELGVAETSSTVLNLDEGNYFIISGSSGVTVPAFFGDTTNISGTIVVKGGTDILWPKGADVNGFTWIWGTIPQNISALTADSMIILDYRVIDKTVFINEVCSNVEGA